MRQNVVGMLALLLVPACATAPRSHDTVPSTPATGSVAWSLEEAFDRIPGVLKEAGWDVTEVNFRTGVIQGNRSEGGYPEWVGVTLLPKVEGGSDFRISVRSSRGGREGSQAAKVVRVAILAAAEGGS
ncbi:MAG: hypothetical protein ACE5HP_00255 [Gemmatimonadota bacterium]